MKKNNSLMRQFCRFQLLWFGYLGAWLFFCYDYLNSGCLLSLAAIIPIKIYSNAEADKDIILKENKNKSGIYMWKNIINDKQYIGSAVDLSNRLQDYYSTAYMEDSLTRSNSHIYRALLKNGYSNFSLTILEYCEPEQCFEREDFYLSSENNEYNISKKAGASMFGRTHSDATKNKISDALTGSNKSDDTKRKMSDAQPTSIKIEVNDIKNNITTSYNSIKEAARVLNINKSVIDNYFRRNQQKPYKGQYTFIKKK